MNELPKRGGRTVLIRAAPEFKQIMQESDVILQEKYGIKQKTSYADKQRIIARGFNALPGMLHTVVGLGVQQLRKRRGNIMNVVLIAVMLFVFTISIFMADTLFTGMTNTTTTPELNSSATGNYVLSVVTPKFNGIFDTVYVLMMIGLGMLSVFGAIVIRSNKLLLFATILTFALLLIITSFIADMIEAFSNESATSGFAERYPSIYWINNHMLLITLFYGAAIILGMFFSADGVQ